LANSRSRDYARPRTKVARMLGESCQPVVFEPFAVNEARCRPWQIVLLQDATPMSLQPECRSRFRLLNEDSVLPLLLRSCARDARCAPRPGRTSMVCSRRREHDRTFELLRQAALEITRITTAVTCRAFRPPSSPRLSADPRSQLPRRGRLMDGDFSIRPKRGEVGGGVSRGYDVVYAIRTNGRRVTVLCETGYHLF